MRTLSKIFALLLFVTTGCNIGPEPIEYGIDACEYCRMTIVDRQHAAEIVTNKGKVYKYDAIECMLNDEENNSEETVAYFLVMDFTRPDAMIDAKKATYLVCESIPSPMGAYLSAFEQRVAAETIKNDKTGSLYSWEEIDEHISQ